MDDKKYFKRLLICDGALFFFTCFSIICCILNSSLVDETQSSSHVMSIVYLILHLGIEAVVFYYSFKAMVKGSSLIKAVMYIKEGVPNMKCKRNALIFFAISIIICAYMCAIIFPLDIFLSFFALGLKFALLNFFALVAIISIFFFYYPKENKD